MGNRELRLKSDQPETVLPGWVWFLACVDEWSWLRGHDVRCLDQPHTVGYLEEKMGFILDY